MESWNLLFGIYLVFSFLLIFSILYAVINNKLRNCYKRRAQRSRTISNLDLDCYLIDQQHYTIIEHQKIKHYFSVCPASLYLLDWCQHYRLTECPPSINCRHKKVELIDQMIRDAPQHTAPASDWSQQAILASDWLIRLQPSALALEWQQSTKRKGVAASLAWSWVLPSAAS